MPRAFMKTKKNKRANKKAAGQKIRISRSKLNVPLNKPMHKRASRTE